MTTSTDELDALVAAVLGSSKYRAVTPDLVRAIGARELAARPNLKTAIKATKNTLHQAGGAFTDAPIDYDRALAELRAAASRPALWRRSRRGWAAVRGSRCGGP